MRPPPEQFKKSLLTAPDTRSSKEHMFEETFCFETRMILLKPLSLLLNLPIPRILNIPLVVRYDIWENLFLRRVGFQGGSYACNGCRSCPSWPLVRIPERCRCKILNPKPKPTSQHRPNHSRHWDFKASRIFWRSAQAFHCGTSEFVAFKIFRVLLRSGHLRKYE